MFLQINVFRPQCDIQICSQPHPFLCLASCPLLVLPCSMYSITTGFRNEVRFVFPTSTYEEAKMKEWHTTLSRQRSTHYQSHHHSYAWRVPFSGLSIRSIFIYLFYPLQQTVVVTCSIEVVVVVVVTTTTTTARTWRSILFF